MKKKAKKIEAVQNPLLAKAVALAKAHAMLDETMQLMTRPFGEGREPDYPFELADAIRDEVFRLLCEIGEAK